MAEHEPIEKIEPIGKSEPTKVTKTGSFETEDSPSKVQFDEAVRKADPSRVEQHTPAVPASEKIDPTQEAQKLSPLDLAAKASEATTRISPVTPNELVDQLNTIRKKIEPSRERLGRAVRVLPEEALSANDSTVLTGHLEHADRALRDASNMTTGVEIGSAIDRTKPPLTRFLGYLTESDKRLSNFITEIQGLDIKKTRLSPSMMMAIQIKLGFIQQELEFFTATLNKSLESVKTIFNVQI